MRTMLLCDRRRGILSCLLVVGCLSLAFDAEAGEETGWRLRVDFGFFDPSGDGITIDTGTTEFRTELEGGAGAGVRGEYQFSRRLGVEFGFFSGASVSVDVEVSSGSGSTQVEVSSFVPFAVGLDVHLTPRSRVDLYLGPQVAWVDYSDIDVGTGTGFTGAKVAIDTDVGPAAILGLDVPVGQRRRWTFQANLRYFDTRMESSTSEGRLEADFDPLVISLGFGYRF